MITSNPVVDALRDTMLVASVRCTALGLTATDKEASKRAAEDASAITGASRVVVNRLAGADTLHRAMTNCHVAAGLDLKGLSTPYFNEEPKRLLPNANFETFLRRFAERKKTHDALKEQLREQAPELLAQARANIGTFNVKLPTPDELVAAYTMDYKIETLPDGEFKGLPPAWGERAAKRLARQLAEAVDHATTDTLKRFVTPLSRFVERIEIYEDRERRVAQGEQLSHREGRFNNSLVTNIKELYDVLESFNITGDERLTELSNQLASLAVTDPDDLRKNNTLRAAAKDRASEVLNNLNDWLGGTPTAPSHQQAA